MASIFTKIIKGEIPSYKIAEDDNFIAFLDVFPIAKGHTLIVPKVEIDYIFDLDDETIGGMHVFAKKVAKALEKAVPCIRIGTMVAGLEVPHAHLHLIPMNKITDLSFEHPKLKFTEEEFKEIQSKVAANL
ncbi:MAG: HIT family protein [Chloroflexia bacterium]|nr:HIT family protein [Chloroflexia bacterium]